MAIFDSKEGMLKRTKGMFENHNGIFMPIEKEYENDKGKLREVLDYQYKVFIKDGVLIDSNIPHTFYAVFSNVTIGRGVSEITQENGYVKIKKNITYTGSTGGGRGLDGYIVSNFDLTNYKDAIIKCKTNYIYDYYACSSYSSSDGAYQTIGTPTLYANWNRNSNYTFTDSTIRDMTDLFAENALWRGNYSKANRTIYLNYEYHVLDLAFKYKKG